MKELNLLTLSLYSIDGTYLNYLTRNILIKNEKEVSDFEKCGYYYSLLVKQLIT